MFSGVTSETNLRMWYSSRLDDNGCGIHMSTDTSTYRHWDARYGRPSRQHRAQDVQQHFRQHRHVTTNVSVTHQEYIQDPVDNTYNMRTNLFKSRRQFLKFFFIAVVIRVSDVRDFIGFRLDRFWITFFGAFQIHLKKNKTGFKQVSRL